MSKGRAYSASSHRSVLRNFFASPRVLFCVNFLKWIVFISALAFASFSFYLLNKNNLEKEQDERFALILASIEKLEASLTEDVEEIFNLFNSQLYGPVQNLEDPILKSLVFNNTPSLISVNLIKPSINNSSLRILSILPDSGKPRELKWQESSELKVFSDIITNIKIKELLTSIPKAIFPKQGEGYLNIALPYTLNLTSEISAPNNSEPLIILLTFDVHYDLAQYNELTSLNDIELSLFNRNSGDKNPIFRYSKESQFNKPDISLTANVNLFSNFYELKINYRSKFTNHYYYLLFASILLISLIIFYTSEYIIKRNKENIEAINQRELMRLKKYVAIREKQLHLLTDHAPIGIMLCDKDGVQLSQNRTFHSIMKIDKSDNSTSSWNEAVHNNDKERVTKEWALAVREKKESEIAFRSQSNKDLLINFKIYPIEFESSKIGLLVFVNENIDHTNENLDESTDKKAEIDSASQSSDNHINQLNNTLENYYSADLPQEEQFIEYPKSLDYNQEEILINKFESSQHEETSQIEDKESIEASVVNILKEVIELLHHKARIKGVKLGVQISATAPTTLQLSPWLLKLSLIELIDSAIERMDNGTIRIIYSTKGEPAKPYFSIKDNSAKSSLSELQNIGTNNYEKALPTLTRENAATFSISELEPKGNKVSLILNQKQSLNNTKSESVKISKRSSRKALVLENDTILREKLRDLLRLTNVECCFASNNKEASLFLNRDAVDFIFVNAEMDQDTLMRLIKTSSNTSKKLPILSITENPDKLSIKNSDIKFINARCTVSDLNNILNTNKS